MNNTTLTEDQEKYVNKVIDEIQKNSMNLTLKNDLYKETSIIREVNDPDDERN